MEDLNMLAADCIVISCCCCECLVLQIVIFVLLELPHKLIRKMTEYAKKRFQFHHRKKRISETDHTAKKGPNSSIRDLNLPPLGVEVEGFLKEIGVHGFGENYCCMEEVEKVLEGLSQKGEFGFGSFWGREEESAVGSFTSTSTCAAKQEFNVQYQFVELVGSFSYS